MRAAPDEILLVFPTVKHLEQLSGFASATSCCSTPAPARSAPSSRGSWAGRTGPDLLPGEPGYAD